MISTDRFISALKDCCCESVCWICSIFLLHWKYDNSKKKWNDNFRQKWNWNSNKTICDTQWHTDTHTKWHTHSLFWDAFSPSVNNYLLHAMTINNLLTLHIMSFRIWSNHTKRISVKKRRKSNKHRPPHDERGSWKKKHSLESLKLPRSQNPNPLSNVYCCYKLNI